MTFRRAVLCLVMLATALGCSSSDDPSTALDGGGDTGGSPFGPPCCCKDGVEKPAGGTTCEPGWSFHPDECPFQYDCREHDTGVDAIADARDGGDASDAACDPKGYCCCDIDVLTDPICTDAGPSCPAPYRLLTPSQCAAPGSCTLVYDTGTRDSASPD